METSTLAWRIGLPHYETESAFRKLLKVIRGHRRLFDELALFETISHHQYTPLDIYATRMEMVSKRMAALRREGVASVGINVLCTIGHVNEAWSTMPPLPFQPMVGHDGSVSRSCACPNTSGFQKHIREKYTLAARARPDFIWVDDDIRMHYHGVAWGCFCPVCLRWFAKRIGRRLSRITLVRAMSDPQESNLRHAWIEQNRASIEALLALVAESVHAVDKRIAMGLMTCGAAWTTYSGVAFERWFKALRAAKARPGGGFYADTNPVEMVRKTLDCGRQRSLLPPSVRDIQYEVENFPYQLLKKSATAMVDECTLALAQGHNGIAFNLNAMTVAYEDFLPFLGGIAKARPVWERWVQHVRGLPTAGLWAAWSPDLMARREVRPGENWFAPSASHYINFPLVFQDVGIPIAADRPGCGTILSGRVAEAFSTAELTAMLSGGLLMDSTALEVLSQRRLAHLTGVRLGARTDNGVRERFSPDSLNESFRGHVRDARIEFWGDAKGMGDVLVPTARGVRVLAYLEDYFAKQAGACLTAYENPLGGRVVVMGYAPWMYIHSVAKRRQLQNLADWACRGRVPVRVEEPVRLIPIVRAGANGERTAVLLMNAGMDLIPEVTVRLRTSAFRARVLAVGAHERVVSLERRHAEGILRLQGIEPWSFRMVLLNHSREQGIP